MNRILIFLFIFYITNPVKAQLPEYGMAFLQDEVAQIYITINPDTLDALLSQENWGNDREFPAQFRYESNQITETVNNIGFRLRGNTSLGAAKKSFKISFNTFVEGRKWLGLEKMNINGSHNDPSMIRAALCWNAIRRAGLPGSRVSFVKLYINNEYRGLYSNIEHIDEEFADIYFEGSQYNSLFKCLYPAPLEFISNNSDDYNYFQFNRRPYDQKTNDYTNDYRELSDFINILNNTSNEDFVCAIERVFNVDNFLKYSAIDALTGNWDGYGYNKNNYYLQVNYRTGQFEFIPYDLDNTLGIDWLGQDWAIRNVNTWWNQNESRPLISRLMEFPEYSNRYKYYLSNYAQTLLHADTLRVIAEGMIELINEAAFEDVYRTLDYGFSFDDFENSLDSAWGNQVDYGIIEYQQLRNSSALQQLNSITAPSPKITGGYYNPIEGKAFARVSNYTGEEISLGISSVANLSGNVVYSVLRDNGTSPDEMEGDGVFSGIITEANSIEGTTLYYQFAVSNGISEHFWPCSARKVYRDTANLNYINEVMSKNNSEIADPNGAYSDWIELYNPNPQAWDADGYYLSDNPDRPNKWPLPAIEIAQGMHEIIWANSLEDSSRFYTNFNLAASGEWLGLFHKEDDHYRLMQYINIPQLNNNESYGQSNDGNGNWIIFPNGASTAGQSNGTAGDTSIEFNDFIIYPNPTTETLYFNKSLKNVNIFDASGQLILSQNNCNQINLSNLNAGIYLLKSEKFSKRFVVLN